jgi:hypothetical protein
MQKLFLTLVVLISITVLFSFKTKSLSTDISHKAVSFTGEAIAEAGGFHAKKRCLGGRGRCAWAIDEQKAASGQTVKVKLNLLDDNNLVVNYLEDFKSEDDGAVDIENDAKLATSLSKQLGKSSITILKGSYSTDFSKSEYGMITLKIVSE